MGGNVMASASREQVCPNAQHVTASISIKAQFKLGIVDAVVHILLVSLNYFLVTENASQYVNLCARALARC